MALARDSGPTSGTAGGGSPHNVTFNNAAGGIVLDLVGFGGGATDTITVATYAGAAMVGIIRHHVTGGVATLQAEIFALLVPATGSNTLATSYSSTGGEENETAVSLSGQDAITPYLVLEPVTVSGGTSIALDFSSMLPGDIGYISAAIGNDAGAALTSPTITGGSTLNSSYTAAFNGTTIWSAEVTAAGVVTLGWTGNFNGVMVGAIIRQAGDDPTGTSGGKYDDRHRFRPSVFSSGTSTLGTKRSAWPDDARDFGWRDALADSRTRM